MYLRLVGKVQHLLVEIFVLKQSPIQIPIGALILNNSPANVVREPASRFPAGRSFDNFKRKPANEQDKNGEQESDPAPNEDQIDWDRVYN